VVVFRALNKEDIQNIVKLELNKVAERLQEHELTLTATDEALALLADLGYDSEFGARPLRRVIQQKVEDPLSDLVLGGEFGEGASVLVDVNEDGEITLKSKEEKEKKKEKAAAPAA
jgi:ATP-dependent Clp protease ATP-binding subunit ClpC